MGGIVFDVPMGQGKMPFETWEQWERRTGNKKEESDQWNDWYEEKYGRKYDPNPTTLPDAGKTDPLDLWDYGGSEEEPVQTPYGPREREEGEYGPYGETDPEIRAKYDPILKPGQAICGTSIIFGGIMSCLSAIYFINCL